MNEPLESRQRKMRSAYSVSNTEADDTEAQVHSVMFAPRDTTEIVPGESVELPPLSPSDLVWRQGFFCGCLFGLVALAVTVLSAWLLVKAMDAGFWWAGKLLGGG